MAFIAPPGPASHNLARFRAPAAEPPPPLQGEAEQAPAGHWNRLAYDVQANVATYLSTRSLRVMTETNRSNAALADDAHVIRNLAPTETIRWLWSLLESGSLDVLETILRPAFEAVPRPRTLEMRGWVDAPNPQGRTLLEAAYRRCDGRSLELLAKIPPTNGGLARRVETLLQIINDQDQVALQHVLAGLPPEARAAHHGKLLRAVITAAHGPSTQDFLRTSGAQAFSRLSDGSSALHLGPWKTTLDAQRIMRYPGSMDALHQVDNDGNTPLLQAAMRGDLIGLEALAHHYPPGPIADIDSSGNGPVRLLFMANPQIMAKLILEPGWAERFTPADKTDTLVRAISYLEDFEYDDMHLGNRSHQSFENLVGAIHALLALPAGQINVHAQVETLQMSALEIFREDSLSDILDGHRKDAISAATNDIDSVRAAYCNADLLENAERHA